MPDLTLNVMCINSVKIVIVGENSEGLKVDDKWLKEKENRIKRKEASVVFKSSWISYCWTCL